MDWEVKSHAENVTLNSTKNLNTQTQRDMLQESTKETIIATIYSKINALLLAVEDFGISSEDASEIEQHILTKLLSMGKDLLAYSFSIRHQELESSGSRNVPAKSINKGLIERLYQSIFGELWIQDRKYHIPIEGNYSPIRASLNLPSTKHSYLLQDWLGNQSTELDYREGVKMVNEILGLDLNATQNKSDSNSLGDQVDSYYERQTASPVPAGNYLCVEWDGKGVPIIQEEVSETSSESTSRSSVIGRLKRGQKRGVKKIATVSVVSNFSPRVRTKESIIRGLFKSPLTPLEKGKILGQQELEVVHKQAANWHQNIHRRAFLGPQRKSIDYGVQLVKERSADQQIPIVILIDGGTGLEDQILEAFAKENMEEQVKKVTIDIVHVSEYVWKAANAILGEKSHLRTEWVKEVLSDILDGKVSKVIEDLKQNSAQTDLSDSAKKTLDKTITYFSNHQHKMDYKACLELGLPVSTALVESSCGHLVKDRMERSGMRWSLNGAQQMMDIRAVKKNGDWKGFIQFVKHQNHNKQRKRTA